MFMPSMGVLPSPRDDRDYPVTAIAPPVALPSEVRLDNRIVKVLRQGFCGTCVGKGCNSILSAGYNKALSSLYIYSRSKELDGIPHIEGTYPRIALKVMHQEGSCPEELFPYTELKDCFRPPKITPRMAEAASPYRIKTYARLWNIIEIKQALAAGLMVGGAFWIGSRWTYYKSGVLPSSDNINIRGLHWVVLTGYNDSFKAVRGLNSWGESWGENGFFWLSYDAFKLGGDFTEAWAVEVGYADELKNKISCLEKTIEIIQALIARILQKLKEVKT